MARKKKKQIRKQQIKQRRGAVSRKRQMGRGNKPTPAPSNRPQQDVLDDMLPLFPRAADGPPTPAQTEEIMITLLDSADLADEPEFDEIIFDPAQAVDAFSKAGEKLGLGPDNLEQFEALSPDERGDKHLEMLEMTAKELLTEEIRQDILARLDKLRLRLRHGFGKRKKVAKVAGLQLFLSGKEGKEMWFANGLVSALIHRSVTAGFELYTTVADVMGAAGVEDDDSALTLMEKIEQSSLTKKASGFLKKVPGLRKFLENETDKIWDEGIEAVYSGKLFLELFTEEELEGGAEIMREAFGGDEDDEYEVTEETVRPQFNEENIKNFIVRIDEYVTELFTPERLDQLRMRLNEVLQDKELPKKWIPFVVILKEYMADENAAENEKGFLIQAFMGEIRAIALPLEEEAEAL